MVIYQGIFFKDLPSPPVSLEKNIDNPHITFAYKPTDDIIFSKDILGKEVKVTIVGFGYNKKVAAWAVVFPDEFYHIYHNDCFPHITISVGLDGKPIDSKKIKHWRCIKNVSIVGKFGYFDGTNVIYE